MALTTLATVALGLSAATAAAQTLDARKTRKETNRRLAQQTLEAKEAAKVETTQEDTGAEIVLGSADADERKRRKTTATASDASTGSTPFGGLSASSKVGL